MTSGPVVLVTAASRHGSTVEVADRITDVLREELAGSAWSVERREVDEVRNVDEYDAMVIGSAVYMGRWMRPAKRLVQRLTGREFLGVWLFSTGPVDAEEPAQAVARTVLTDHPDVVDHVILGGKLDVDQLSGLEHLVVAGLGKPSVDHRSWPEIEEWARSIARRLAVVAEVDAG